MSNSRRVLCVRREHEHAYNPFDVNSGHLTVWVDKQESENSHAFRQVIPYIVVHRPDGTFLKYHRRGSEQRLRGLMSIGLGGHIEEGETFLDCMKRELEEEIGLKPGEYSYIPTELSLCISETPVSHAHLGIVVIVLVRAKYEAQKTDEVADPRFYLMKWLLDPKFFLELEDWSKITIKWIEQNYKKVLMNEQVQPE